MATQACNDAPCERQNFAIPDCVSLLGRGYAIAIAPASLRIPIDQLTRESFYNAYFSNNPDTRIYGLPQIHNLMIDGVAPTFSEDDAGFRYLTRQNPSLVVFEFWEREAQFGLLGQIERLKCNDWSIFVIDLENKVAGQKFATTDNSGNVTYEFGGIPINTKGTSGIFSFANSATTGKIAVEFQFGQLAKPSDFYIVDGNALRKSDTDGAFTIFDFVNPPRVIHCNLTVTGSDPISATIIVNTIHRQGAITTFDNPGDVTGLTTSRFQWENFTENTTGGLSGLTEPLLGRYDVAVAISDWNAGDAIKIETNIDVTASVNYLGSTSFVVEP